MELSSLVFWCESLPDFELLKKRGWVHPKGLQGEDLTKSLVKTFGDYEIQIMQSFDTSWKFCEAYVHPKSEKLVMKKGEGKGMTREVVVDLIEKMYAELEEEPEF